MNCTFCTFCKNKGIQKNHNHTVRNFTLPDKPIICPVLLSTKCTFCKTLGHTRQYCPIRIAINNNSYTISNSNINNLKRSNQTSITELSNKLQKIL
jgi:hypothetical protein